jgi:hypothetical protein
MLTTALIATTFIAFAIAAGVFPKGRSIRCGVSAAVPRS